MRPRLSALASKMTTLTKFNLYGFQKLLVPSEDFAYYVPAPRVGGIKR